MKAFLGGEKIVGNYDTFFLCFSRKAGRKYVGVKHDRYSENPFSGLTRFFRRQLRALLCTLQSTRSSLMDGIVQKSRFLTTGLLKHIFSFLYIHNTCTEIFASYIMQGSEVIRRREKNVQIMRPKFQKFEPQVWLK